MDMGTVCGGLVTITFPAEQVLLLLVAGHLIGDFLLQSHAMAEDRPSLGTLGLHAALITLSQALALLPFLGGRVLMAAVAIGTLHGLVDLVKSRWRLARPNPLILFLLDQAVHLVVLLGAAVFLVGSTGPLPQHVHAAWMPYWLTTLGYLGVFAFTWSGGSGIVVSALATLGTAPASTEAEGGIAGSGRVIGGLERTLTLILILLGQWAAIVLLITAKSFARFEELKERRFAEYYLIGTLTSLLVAILTGIVLRLVVCGGV